MPACCSSRTPGFMEVEEDDLYNDDDDDDTLGQYDSENECTIMIPNDDGEYSDVE